MSSPTSGPIRVLHVDDEPGFSEMVGEFLERQSTRFEVETTTSPAEALDRVQEDHFDCVVSDYDMPGQNGIEFLEAVREDFPDIPFILYTGKGSEEIASEAISAGVTDYLQKERGTSQYEVLANRIINTVEKYQAQTDLAVSQRRLNLFFEQSPLGVIRWDENFDFERMNEKATEILGYDGTDLSGRSWETIVPESDRAAVDEVVSNLLENEGGFHSVNENIRKDGERIVCEWHNRVVTDDEEVVAIYSQFQDVTERTERAQELQETKVEVETSITEKERLNDAFHRFQDIVNDGTLSFEERMHGVLDLGVEFLGLETGIISRIDPPEYTVEYVEGPDDSIKQGNVLDLRDTFCELVFDAEGAVAFRSPEDGDVEDHPAYADLGLEAYLGERLMVDGEPYGTLNFSMAAPREEPFSDGERSFIRTLAEWVSNEIRRHQQEAEIRRLHDLYRTVLSNMRETVLLTDEHGELTYVCPNVQFIFGYDAAEVEAMDTVDALFGEGLVTGEDLEPTGEVRNIETEVTDADGQEHTVLVTVRRIDIEDGSRHYSVRDITERAQREQDLREEREFIDQALDAIEDVFFVTDPNLELRRWNDRVREVTGYTDDELTGKNALEFFPTDEAETLREAADEVMASGQATIEADIRTSEGERRPCEIRSVRLTNPSGEPTAIVGIGRDIGDRRQREATLERLHAANRDLMAATTKEEVVKTGSETAESVLGLPLNGVHLYDGDADALVPVAWTERTEDIIEEIPPTIPLDDALAGRAYRTGELTVFEDLEDEPERLNPATPIRSELHVPLGEHGVLMAGSTRPDAFAASDVALGRILAANIEAALDRVEREEHLARQESLLAAQQEAVLDGLLVIDEDRQIISYNDRFLDLWDLEEEVVKDGDEERAIDAAIGQVANPEAFREELQYLYDHPDETAEDQLRLNDGRVFHRYTTPLIGEDGTQYGRLWTFRDITDRERQLRETERERNRFEAVFETVPDPTVHVVFDGSEPVIQHVNEAFEEVFGVDAETARGESVDDLIVPAEKQPQATDINESVRGDGRVQTEMRRETVTGERPFLFTARTMTLGEGDDERVEGVGTYVDLTEQKRRETELARQNERLDEFARVLSHDLRNPLNVADGRLELAQEDCDSEHLHAVAGSLERMESLIEDTLTLAREGSEVREFEPTNLAELAQQCWATVDTAEATLVIETDQDILADKSRLQQVLENLFRNAVEHGGSDVEITVGDLTEHAGFFVADDGPGIPEGQRGNVFEPGISSSDSGTGFGLAIVKQIAEAHGWEVSLTTTVDGGARIEFSGVRSS